MAQFTSTPLMGGGVLVEGMDDTGKSGRTLLHSDRWAMAQHLRKHKDAEDIFGAAVQQTFGPLIKAAEDAKALLAEPSSKWDTVVLTEATEGVAEERVPLDADGIILNILDAGRFDLLRWVGDDILVAIQD
jgi:hypothetical protein